MIHELRAQLPEYAKDLRLNLESVLSEHGAPGLSAPRIAMVALASAIASRHAPLTHAVAEWAAGLLDEAGLNAARTAAAVMAMTNVYYRFTHLVGDPEYQTLRAGLRMNALANPGPDKIGFELASLAVSAINGCGKCMDSHEKTLRHAGVDAPAVQSAVRIGSVIHAVAVTLEQAGAAAQASRAVAA
jgi:alkyl hydroperoxide reductase subunit D